MNGVLKWWKIADIPKISVKMRTCKTFYRVQTVIALKEILQSPPNPPPPDLILLNLWNKNFLMGIYRNIQTFAFNVLQECSSWTSRNGVVQMFSMTPSRNMFAGKFVKSEKLLTVLWEHVIFNVKWVEVRKMSEFFEQTQLAHWRYDSVVITSWLMLSQRCGMVENESCDKVSLRRCKNVAAPLCQ